MGKEGASVGPAELLGGIMAILGALLIVPACILPYAHFSDENGPTNPSIFNPGFEGGEWYVPEPLAVMLIGIAAGLLIVFSRRPLLQVGGAAALMAVGIQTVFFFLGYIGYALTYSFDAVGIGSVIGLAAALCLLSGGVIAGVGAGLRQSSAPSPYGGGQGGDF
jgi:hypothetical protein